MTTTGIPDPSAPDEAAPERCGQCGAPAAPEQRYCLNCGFHRRNASDPVARYLSEASAARVRVAAATALAAQRRRTPRLGLRPVSLLVAVALLAGIVIGNATRGGSLRPATSASRTSPSRMTTTHGVTKPTAATKPTGGTSLKTATGSSYVNQEANLPNTVTP